MKPVTRYAQKAFGLWLPPCTTPVVGQPLVTQVLGANTLRYHRVFGEGLISKIGMDIVASSGNIGVAVYRNTGTGRTAQPAARAATSGSVASPGTGYREISLTASVYVNDGDWFAVHTDDGSLSIRGTHSDSAVAIANGWRWYESVAFPPPVAAGTLVSTNISLLSLIGVP